MALRLRRGGRRVTPNRHLPAFVAVRKGRSRVVEVGDATRGCVGIIPAANFGMPPAAIGANIRLDRHRAPAHQPTTATPRDQHI